ncbi:MAG: hypothetical protein MK042_08900 [Cognatishimia sp.]|nr:hypothetical protein [Cognatishimia sp.]
MEVLLIVGSLVAFLLFIALRDILKDYRKRKTMRQSEDGTWTWVGWNGTIYTSAHHPFLPNDPKAGDGIGGSNFGEGGGGSDFGDGGGPSY